MKIILFFVVLLVILGGVYATFFATTSTKAPAMVAEPIFIPPAATSALDENMSPMPTVPVDEILPPAPEIILAEIKDFSFSPKEIRVRAGDTIRWTNSDKVGHTVTADDYSFGSNLLAQKDEFEYNFASPGIYQYHCGPHPKMKGTIIVE